ncbi:MAG: hypothetical protein MK082_00440 [Phycisphaerales bacterium]|nr:hypothetical protein [Phycisphaerales bacterium]
MQSRVVCAAVFLAALSAWQQSADAQRLDPLPIKSDKVPSLRADLQLPGGGGTQGGLAGSCDQQVSTHTDADFSGGTYILQGGFAEDEMAAVSFVLPESAFPIKVDMVEMIFGTSSATTSTTTEWSMVVWSGTPRSGQIQYEFSSDGELLPHIELGPGTNGINVQLSVDPSDPDQMYVEDDGSHTFSVGFRIDRHNQQIENPCFAAPPSCCNAFPATDTSGLDASTQNWIRAVDCGIFGCPSGWSTFAEWPSICRPSGDWVIRATWTPANCSVLGACCTPEGVCVESTDQANCEGIGGVWTSDAACSEVTCEPPSDDVPCCFAATGGCLELSEADCLAAGGAPGPVGVPCDQHTCFPVGAVCMPNGSCLDGLTPDEAETIGGTFMGDGTTCANIDCPEPTAACCFPSGFCLVLTELDCTTAAGTWNEIGTTCEDGDGSGGADLCETGIPGDINGDGAVDGADLTILLGEWGTANAVADLNGDGTVDGADLTTLLGNWTG